MNEILENYIRKQVNEMPKVLNRNLTSLNNKKFIKRDDFYNLKIRMDDFLENKSDKRCFILPGLRGVGKTVLLYQCYEYLLKYKDISSNNLLYISCDVLNKINPVDLNETIESYVKTNHNTSVQLLDQKVFIFIDEIHYDKNWALNTKIVHDQSPNIFMILTGSYSLHMEYNADAARRLITYPILPLDYSQHLKLKYGYESDISNRIIKLLFEKNVNDAQIGEKKVRKDLTNIIEYDESEWENYLRYGSFCSTLNEIYTEDITEILWSTISKIIVDDISSIFHLNNNSQENVYRVLTLLASQKPGEISQNRVASSLGKSTSTINHIFEILEKTGLLFHYQAYGGLNKKARKSWKYYLATPSLKNAVNEYFGNTIIEKSDYQGILLENMVASLLFNLNHSKRVPEFQTFYDSAKGGVDFILQREFQKPVPIEVGLGKKSNKQIFKAINRYGSDYGVVISSRTENVEEQDGVVYITPQTFSFI